MTALIGTVGAALASFGAIVVGRPSATIVAYGVASTTLFVFVLILYISHGKEESKEEFLRKGAVRTEIATSFTVAYLMLLTFSLAPQLGLSFDNGILANFQFAYIFTIGFYFITATLERVVDTIKGKQSSLFGS